MKIKILVAVANYPSEDKKLSLAYVHTRNIFYVENGLDVTVLNFRAKNSYLLDGVKVIPLKDYKKDEKRYDVLICHAANIKEHYRFLLKYGEKFPRFIFFFHGHEVLMSNHVYPKNYSYIEKRYWSEFFGDIYDFIKLRIWKKYYQRVAEKSWFVFVSKWMLDEFLKWTKIPFRVIENRHSITYNCIGKPFETMVYEYKEKKEYDFVTIRHNIDNSKYAIDIVNKIAKKNPDYKFLMIGKGEFFDHYEKASNIKWINATMDHKDIVSILQKCRCALMPTRTDAQGLMMCEMASTGIPLLTSDIPVCHEVLKGFENIMLFNNDDPEIDIGFMLKKLEQGLPYPKNEKFFNYNTSGAEVELIKKIC